MPNPDPTEESVERHPFNIFKKAGVSTGLGFALYAIKHQLVASIPDFSSQVPAARSFDSYLQPPTPHL
jgi:hypothetical protein